MRNGLECGIAIQNYGDVKVGDVIEAFVTERVATEAQEAHLHQGVAPEKMVNSLPSFGGPIMIQFNTVGDGACAFYQCCKGLSLAAAGVEDPLGERGDRGGGHHDLHRDRPARQAAPNDHRPAGTATSGHRRAPRQGAREALIARARGGFVRLERIRVQDTALSPLRVAVVMDRSFMGTP